MFARFDAFDGRADKGVVLLPCELIDQNGPALKAAVLHFARLWQLDPGFEKWVENACTFCSTLVDRIVTGKPAAVDLPYEDQFVVAAEYYYLFVIEGPQWLADELKLAGADLNIQLVDDIKPYKQRKVGILNGGHTALVPVALLAGLESVGEAVDDAQIGAWLRAAISEEIIPALPMERAGLEAFAQDVILRFRNPAIHHKLASIALNSWSKFAARIMPQIIRYTELHDGALPQRLVTALAATLLLYRGGVVTLADDPVTLAWFSDAWDQVEAGQLTQARLVGGWLACERIWGRDLNRIDGLADAVTSAMALIASDGMRAAM